MTDEERAKECREAWARFAGMAAKLVEEGYDVEATVTSTQTGGDGMGMRFRFSRDWSGGGVTISKRVEI